MMQQQMTEQNQAGCQSGQQQMVLCPVRVVYETQMLVQPGEQIQPNQTFFINPQNPPPWVQNRQMQNQVIYVQSMPNNYMPSVQPHMDPNQLYFQQSYQQIVQQPMIHQGHDMRQYQVNMMPANVVQNTQNIVPNMPNQVQQAVQQVIQQNERINEPNYIQMTPNMAPNTPITSVNSPQIVKQQNVNVQAIQNQQMVNQRQLYLNPGQQSNQQLNMTRPQLITVNPMQQPNVQTFDKTQTSVTNTQVMSPMYANTMTNRQIVNTMAQTEARMRKTSPNVAQISTNVRNVSPSYVYRPIQPRPQFRTNMPNVSVQNTMTNINVPNSTPQIPNLMNMQPVLPNTNLEVRKTHKETRGRKRKSESPDELNKKVTIVNINTALPSNPVRIAQAPVFNPVKSVEIGVNTSPVHRPKAPVITQVVNDTKVISVNKSNNDSTIANDIVKKCDNISDKDTKTSLEANAADKVRYTVFPQARVRPPKDEFNIVNVNILKDTKNILYSDEKNEIQLESKSLLKEKILSRTENKKESEDKCETNKEVSKTEEMKTESMKDTKDVKDYVLTHVLDGIVIQESNTAFPIREPTKIMNVSGETKRDVVKVDAMLKGNCLELPISDLKLKEVDRTKEEKDNPFFHLKISTVKSWTVDELCAHLTKYNWDETISLLQEHEIDGESLLLVSKPQLLHIGVKEKYADVICEFVKS